nr:MAG TPA: hypothetical protein [Caudoviricetes sp.]
MIMRYGVSAKVLETHKFLFICAMLLTISQNFIVVLMVLYILH